MRWIRFFKSRLFIDGFSVLAGIFGVAFGLYQHNQSAEQRQQDEIRDTAREERHLEEVASAQGERSEALDKLSFLELQNDALKVELKIANQSNLHLVEQGKDLREQVRTLTDDLGSVKEQLIAESDIRFEAERQRDELREKMDDLMMSSYDTAQTCRTSTESIHYFRVVNTQLTTQLAQFAARECTPQRFEELRQIIINSLAYVEEDQLIIALNEVDPNVEYNPTVRPAAPVPPVIINGNPPAPPPNFEATVQN